MNRQNMQICTLDVISLFAVLYINGIEIKLFSRVMKISTRKRKLHIEKLLKTADCMSNKVTI